MSVTELDWFIVAFALLLAWLGFRQGFIVGVLSFGGFAVGAIIGTRLGPLLLPRGSASPYAPAFGLIGALVAGGILATGLEGLGLRLRRELRLPGLGVLDGMAGALLSAAVALGIVWIAAAVVAQTPGGLALRSDIQRSAILGALNRVLPPSGPLLNALARLDPLPQLSGPLPDLAPPSGSSISQPGVREASRSVVRILGIACGLAIEGSGWVARPGTIVTNAHVVAGEQDTTIEVGGRIPALPAHAILFDPTVDLAVLRVPGLNLPSLSLVAHPVAGSVGAILGYPENGSFAARPGRIGRTQPIVAQNAYGQGSFERLLTPLRGLVQPGNSGGPMVNPEGQVLTTIFASTSSAGVPGGYGVANATVAEALAQARGGPVSTGPCGAG
jgi:S1-C subfamily serine protease